jgi:ribosomal protein S18 acetylase RimI-like enzyme
MRPLATIRPFRPSDQTSVRSLILAGLSEHFEQLKPELNPDLDDIWASYPAAGGRFYVVEQEETVVGSGGLTREGAGVWRIVRVSVAPSVRRHGIGRQITQFLVSTCQQIGAREIVVETNEDWVAAIGLYLRCGFTIEGYRNGECHMKLDLANLNARA